MNKLKALLSLLYVGREMTNATAWKNAHIVGSLLLSLVGVVSAFGTPISIDNSTIASLGAGIAGVVNAYLIIATDSRVGLTTTAPVQDGATAASTRRDLPDLRG